MGFDMINFLDGVLTWQFEARGFKPLDPGAERHGSWEWIFSKMLRDLDRFVVVALTNPPVTITPTEPWYAIEVWAGAANKNRFVRRLVSEFRAVGTTEFESTIRDRLIVPLAHAMEVAESLRPVDLVQSYPSPHSASV